MCIHAGCELACSFVLQDVKTYTLKWTEPIYTRNLENFDIPSQVRAGVKYISPHDNGARTYFLSYCVHGTPIYKKMR